MQQPNRPMRRSARIAYYLLATPPGQRALAAGCSILCGLLVGPHPQEPTDFPLAVLLYIVIGYGFCAYLQAIDRDTDLLCKRFLRRRRPQSTAEDGDTKAVPEEHAA